MNNLLLGVILGIAAGLLDVVPMFAQKLSMNAILSAFFLWVVSGFLIASSSLGLPGALKGIVISFLVLMPCLFIIASNGIKTLIPVFVMTLVLGGLLGFFISKFSH